MTTTEKPSVSEEERRQFKEEIGRCWPAAKSRWSRFLLLNEPELSSEAHSVAQIHLGTRQVVLNDELIKSHHLFDCIEGLLSHEVGHHVRYPGTLAVEARMRLLERSIIPLPEYSLTNLFQDLMINEFLGDELRHQFIKVYQSFTSQPAFHSSHAWKRDPAFLFYLSLFEVLWDLAPGELIGSPESKFAEEFPGYRAEAHVLVHELFRMEPNIYTQFLYFTSVMTRYLKPMIDDMLQQFNACQCGADVPTPEDWADALSLTQGEKDAIERARNAGWFDEDQGERLSKLNELEERIASLPGFGTDDAVLVPDTMAAYYRQLAEQHLIKPPALPRWGEAIVPTTLEDWEFGDPVREIDWMTTLIQRGSELGAVQPMRRVQIPEMEGHEVRLWQPRMEIYLDVSGSMPNPIYHLNAMTLAAQILTLGTTRAGGLVRAALYSTTPVLYWEWCRSEIEISKFLMHYVGAGTVFPFELLAKSTDECRDDAPIRVVISDNDFIHNYNHHPEARSILISAIKNGDLILLLHRPDQADIDHYQSLGAKVIAIQDFNDFPKIATQLTRALFPDS